MEQVDKIKLGKYILITLLVFLFFGCASKNEPIFSQKSFDDTISKDQLLHAVKRVFTLTDKDAFLIDAYRDEVKVTKPKAVHKLYTMDIQNDYFYFKVDENNTNQTLDASLSISRSYGIDEEDRYYLDQESFTHNLFWDRVEYLLGLKNNWRICTVEYIDGYLCDMVDLQNRWGSDKDLIDLNTTSKPPLVERINLGEILNQTPKKEKPKMSVEEIHFFDENEVKNSSDKSDDKKTEANDPLKKRVELKNIEERNSDIKSFKINHETIDEEK